MSGRREGVRTGPRPRGAAPSGRSGLPKAAGAVAGVLLLLLACGGGEASAPSEGEAPPPAAGEVSPEGAPAAAEEPPARQDAGSDAGGGTPEAEPEGLPPGVRTVRITVGGHPVTVEIADTDEKRQRGLMHRESLPEDHGMLFVYDSPRRLSFWMRNTLIPLDVAFLDGSGRIVDIQQMEAMSDETHTSRAPALYALEMRRGWFDEHGVEIGDTVEF